MAAHEEVEGKILEKMYELIGELKVERSGYNRATANLALAINHLAEARAWLERSDQAHGGTSNPSEGA